MRYGDDLQTGIAKSQIFETTIVTRENSSNNDVDYSEEMPGREENLQI